MKRLSITQLVPGMTVAEDVYDLDHELLIQKGDRPYGQTDHQAGSVRYPHHFCRGYHTTRAACGGFH